MRCLAIGREGDLAIGGDLKSAMGTLVERKTRFVVLLHLPDGRSAECVRDALMRRITELPAALRRSLTWDQGREMAEHVRLAIDTDVSVYFCNPHSPWQRGSVENTNGLRRQYFPKDASFGDATADQLDAIADSLNRRAHKTLAWRSPAEVYPEAVAMTGRSRLVQIGAGGNPIPVSPLHL
jgi:transposase, IS30 family